MRALVVFFCVRVRVRMRAHRTTTTLMFIRAFHLHIMHIKVGSSRLAGPEILRRCSRPSPHFLRTRDWGGGDGSMLLLGEELIVFVRRQAGWDLAHDDECHVHGTTRSGSGQSYDYGCGWMDGWVDVDGWVGRCRNGWCKF